MENEESSQIVEPPSSLCDEKKVLDVDVKKVYQSKIGKKANEFRKKWFPDTSISEWSNWEWQLKNRIYSFSQIEEMFGLLEEERKAKDDGYSDFPISITPYYASLIDVKDPKNPVRKAVIPTYQEFIKSPEEEDDPLHEDSMSPVPGIVHRYPDRVLFLVTNQCSNYCHYCTRSRMVGHVDKRISGAEYFNNAIAYIESNKKIRDVLISGGDPLTMKDEELIWIISRIRKIKHVEIIRIGTKVPVVLPYRITNQLVKSLKRFHPLWMSIHFMHPDELTEDVAQACERLVDAGIPLGSQTVLLKGINDDVETMRKLNCGLMKIRIKPYYLYQCDPISGSRHFRTSVKKGLEIIKGLRGWSSGYAVPSYVIDAPGGGGKIQILNDMIVGKEGKNLIIKNFEGKLFKYPDYIE